MNAAQLIGQFVVKEAASGKAKEANVGGDLTTGDGLQTGGTLIVEKGGSMGTRGA
ncbi:hypothetical protein IscW_ISCW010600 [Ixodes scapularis]|uniref:Uncharacterized protein n=1 Tax=Ixodes scapularis TaxID=6945 RepID=B7Q6R6_IXOSC|nr:hypothetical protein IscW_ISCW010600 [Ixodes scapularis]|eukprot:XP_002403281.1 hypothetical protein IscW_ISCW010600 [Ixodes scapularis]